MDNMTDCEKMAMFIEDNYAFEYIVWENHILPLNENTDDVEFLD